ncbi:MAG: galactokinase family protein [Blastocatellia bacterium]|nr:galactokinase family protein [Blastocatellia bacterium]
MAMRIDGTDTERFLSVLKENGALFDAGRPVVVTRAPGRLDLMGGIADYSGALVLQLPIAAAAHVALQRRSDRTVRIVSLGEEARDVEIPLSELQPDADDASCEAIAARFHRAPADHWAAYAAGAFPILTRDRGCEFTTGATILIQSDVPEGKGVSSSAALEVSVMQAVAAAFNLDLPPRELAFLCQRVENLIAGAPCGVMDQMTAACGEADQLLMLLCQPGELRGTVRLPETLAVWGIDSGIRHSVGGADYGTVRAAAFMGYRMIAAMAGLECRPAGPGRVVIDDPRWKGYLANITPAEFAASYASHLPKTMDGAAFLSRYDGFTDAVTTIQPEREYPVFEATRHPIDEHARVQRFAALLADERPDAPLLGELMFAAHASYSACGLGADGTDEIVRLVREAGPAAGLYGAKITGGGSGGTVAVLGRRDAQPAVEAVAASYAARSGRRPLLIRGSSPGAALFGHLTFTKESSWQFS